MKPPVEGQFIEKIINGPVRKAAEWGVSVNTVHPSTHRLKNAIGLTLGLMCGRHTMNLLVGETPSGEKIDKENVPAPLRPLHGIMAYDHFSDDPKDRWMKVVDLWTPAVLGAAGAVLGSHDFAMEQPLVQEAYKTLHHNGVDKTLTLEKAEKAAIVAQSWPWRMLSGATSVFGSSSSMQLIPGPTNYGTTLSNSFLGTVARNKLHTPYLPFVQEFWTGNKHPFPYGPASMVTRLRDYLVHNPAKTTENEQKMAYAILEPWFGQRVNQKHVDKFLSELHGARDKFLAEGGIPETLKAECQKQLDHVMTGLGLERTLHKIGLNPETAMIGRNGFIETMSRMLGADARLTKLEEEYRASYRARHGITKPASLAVNEMTHEADAHTIRTGTVIAGGAALGIAAMAANARGWHQSDNDALFQRDRNSPAPSRNCPPGQEPEEFSAAEKKLYAETLSDTERERLARECKNKEGFTNGKVLPFMEWATDALNAPETLGGHRVMCALGLSVGGLAGMKIADTLAGRTLSGAVLAKDKVPEFLHKIYNKLPYNPHSDLPKDRWGYVMHFLIPGLTGAAGIIGASQWFFQNRTQKANKAEFIDDYEDKATQKVAGPWTGLTAATALFVTPSGFSYLPFPFPNYGTALGTRFTLSSGRKMIFPGLGEMWTGTASRYPYGPSKLRDVMIKYAVNNKDPHPEQLEEMAIGILKPWFKDLTAEQVQQFVDKVEADRDHYCRTGGVPEAYKRDCEQELARHFKGAGLEKTLREIGLDPMKADLGNNGISGQIARYLGAEKPLQAVRAEYKEKYTERLAREQAERLSREQGAAQPDLRV